MISSNTETGPLRIDLWRICRIVCVASAAFIAIGVARELIIGRIGTATFLEDLRHFAFDAEQSLPAWYSSLLMVTCATLFFAVARLTSRSGGADVFRWALLGLIFIAMAVDETVSFHEVLIDPLRGGFETSGILYFAWVVPGSIAVALTGLYYMPFLWRLPLRSALLFAAAGAIYLSGALGMEFVGGALAEQYGMQAPQYLAVAVLEESLEIAGLTVLFMALTDHLARHWPVWSIVIAAEAETQKSSSAAAADNAKAINAEPVRVKRAAAGH